MSDLRVRMTVARTGEFPRGAGVKASVTTILNSIGNATVSTLKNYPPAPPNSKYVRTGNLGRSWTVDRVGSNAAALQVSVSNSADYASFVQGPNQRGLFASIGWQRVTDVFNDEWAKQLPALKSALTDLH